MFVCESLQAPRSNNGEESALTEETEKVALPEPLAAKSFEIGGVCIIKFHNQDLHK